MKNKKINLSEINNILSETLIKVIDKEISLKQATVIAKLAQSLSKNIVSTELQDRVVFLEQALKLRK
jgi:hypothetical protein